MQAQYSKYAAEADTDQWGGYQLPTYTMPDDFYGNKGDGLTVTDSTFVTP